MKRAYKLFAASLLVAAIFPCSIDTSPSFFPVRRPEKFDSTFLRGELGIIPSTLSSRYKLVAWRYLAGLPLDVREQKAILDREKREDTSYQAKEQWQTVRKLAGGSDIYFFNTSKASRLDQGAYYDNCLADAFTTAAHTLSDRQKLYADSNLLNGWLVAQDQVFKNCTSNQPEYPGDPGTELTPLARADRMYQIAVAHFYAEDLKGAEQRFRAIADDNNSPWRDTSAYMVARTLIREASLLHDPQALAEAKEQLNKIVNGPFRDSAQGLIGYIDALSEPSAELRVIAGKLTARRPGPAFSDALEEAVFALSTDRFRQTLTQSDTPEPFDWVSAMGSDSSGLSIQRWSQTRSTLWLTAALVHARTGQQEDADLIDAALKVPESSPAFDTVTYHSIRLMIGDGETENARRKLDSLLGGKRRSLDSVDNAYREQRMSIATDFDDFLRWAARRPIGIREESYPDSNVGADDTPALGYDSVEAFNDYAPLAKLAAAAESTRLPGASRVQIAISAWTRAFILGDDDAGNRLSLLLAKAHREWGPDLQSFRGENGEAKRFAGAFFIVRHSDFHPNIFLAFSPDWWCAQPLPTEPGRSFPQAVLSSDDRMEATGELQRLHDNGAAQDLLGSIIMSWSKAHPEDPRVPESLHRLVRVTRYGCRGVPESGGISKAAFDLLHKRYPASNWTSKTPYWFNQ